MIEPSDVHGPAFDICGWYKRRSQRVTILVAAVTVVAMNVDAIAMFGHLQTYPVVDQAIVGQATHYAQTAPIGASSDPSALAGTLAAPFWIDMLDPVILILAAGEPPEEDPKPPKSVPVQVELGQSQQDADRARGPRPAPVTKTCIELLYNVCSTFDAHVVLENGLP